MGVRDVSFLVARKLSIYYPLAALIKGKLAMNSMHVIATYIPIMHFMQLFYVLLYVVYLSHQSSPLIFLGNKPLLYDVSIQNARIYF